MIFGIKERRRMMRSFRDALVIGISFGYSLAAQPSSRHNAPTLAQFSTAIEELAKTASPAVVQITAVGRGPVEDSDLQLTGFVAKQSSAGSGVIVDPAGYIVTNAHVVHDARRIEVSVIDQTNGRRKHFVATTVGMDRETDLAVLKIDATGLPTLSFLPDPQSVKQGQVVVALGSPLGLNNSLTVGFVSAAARQLNPTKPDIYIQTDAPINPGNSGGPLLDTDGRIVGINTLIVSESGGSEGIGFAIPSNVVRRVYQGIRKDGTIYRGAIGVIPQDITPILASALGLDRDYGVILSDIMPDSPAEGAGLQQGDVILAVDGTPIERSREFIDAVYQHSYGEQIALDILRDKERLKKTVGVLSRSGSPEDLEDLAKRDADLVRRLGILALTLDQKVTPMLPQLRRLYGVVVAGLPAEFASVNPGLVAGDVIYELNGSRTETIAQLRAALDRRKIGDAIALLVEHSGKMAYVSFILE
ncbi:MAG TPA: trypsin-like peptidase domain-containing protein [Bryobacteraceae bacterium]|nr:trypsin-like peptidase domain-containing protein [Bryobacteraceae bacterium]